MSKKAGLVIGVVVILGLLIVGTLRLLDEPMAVLFSDMEARDAARVVEQLDKIKIDHQLAEGGTKVMVSKDEVHAIRLRLMGSDVPLSGGVGFELFDDTELGMTEFAQRINYQRALEGELTRTIVAFREVKYARVHLVMPKSGLFKKQDSRTSASVTLFLKEGARLNVEQISGIQRLVAASVPELNAENVTVSDQMGNTLSAPIMKEAGVGAISGRLQKKKEVELYLVSKVNEVLTGVFGPNQAMVSIDVRLNYEQKKTTEEGVVPSNAKGEGLMLRRRESTVKGEKAGNGNAGNTTTEIEYKLGSRVEQIVENPGRIERISIGILVPADTDSQQRDEIESLVSMAVGLDPARGDGIALYSAVSRKDTVVAGIQSQAGAEVDAPLGNAYKSEMADAWPALDVAAEEDPADLYKLVQENPLLLSIGGLCILLVLMMLVLLFRATGRTTDSGPGRLSDQEREQLLNQLRDWMDGTGDGVVAMEAKSS